MQPVIVHRQRFVDGKGRERIEEVVRCPRQGCLRPASACGACGHGGEVRFDDRFDADVVDCDLAPHANASAVPPETRAALAEPLRAVPAGDVCTRDIVCAQTDAPIRALLRIFDERALGAIPIVSDDGGVVGIVAAMDLALAGDAKSAADLMTRTPICISEATPVTRAAAIMAFEGVHHLPVVGWGGRIVGMLSSLDVLRFIGQSSGALIPRTTARQRQKNDE